MARNYRFIDLFCGIGGFHIAAESAANSRNESAECVFASDINIEAARTYEANFGIKPFGDITKIAAEDVPDHDLLFAGFPCQPFSIIGEMKGFSDDRGTLFFDIKRILQEKQPAAFVLENVKQLRSHDQGRTLQHIMHVLQFELGYQTQWQVLNALDYGLPQKRERIVIVGFREPAIFAWPQGGEPMKPLSEILQKDEDVPRSFFASDYIRERRALQQSPDELPTIWHENKSGNISKLPYSCALRAGASYNYLLVDGKRRLTEREMFRLQGFPDSYQIVSPYSAARHQIGNSVPVPMIQAVIKRVMDALCSESPKFVSTGTQGKFVFERRRNSARA